MPAPTEIAFACLGAFRLFLFDHHGYQNFNFSREGFWRSFFVALLLAPLYLFIIAMQYRLVQATGAPEQLQTLPTLQRVLSVQALVYPIYWVSFPFAMLAVTRLLAVEGRYVPFIIVYNWSGIVAVGIEALPFAAFALGILPAPMVSPCVYASLVIALVYRWSITHTMLGVSTGTAVGVVFIDLLLVMAIAIVTQLTLL